MDSRITVIAVPTGNEIDTATKLLQRSGASKNPWKYILGSAIAKTIQYPERKYHYMHIQHSIGFIKLIWLLNVNT